MEIRSSVEYLQNDTDMRTLKTLPALERVGAAKPMGFGYFIASQDIVMGSVHNDDAVRLTSKKWLVVNYILLFFFSLAFGEYAGLGVAVGFRGYGL